MKMSIISCVALLLLGFAIPGLAQSTVAEDNDHHARIADRLVKLALDEEKGYRLLGELCNLGCYRLCGSEGSLKAVEWASSTMKKLGFGRVTMQSITVPHWERGGTEYAAITNSTRYAGKVLRIGALGLSIGTPEAGITAGVLEVQSFEQLRQQKDRARGKWIFFNRPMESGVTDTFVGYGQAVNQRAGGAIEAANVGGIGALVRSVTTQHDDVPHTGALNYREDVSKIPAAAIGLVSADFLSTALREEPELQLTVKLSCAMLTRASSYNVMTELTGTEKPEEVIVVGGHLDSWDYGHGAHDDGAGCLQALEVLDLFTRAGIRPKRTIRCVFFMNEEMGIDGALAYGKYAASSQEKHLAAIESDRGAFTPRGFSVQTQDPAVLAKLQSWLPYLQKARIEWAKPGGSGVDISQIKNARALIAYVPDDQRYFDVHHSANDVFATVHPREFSLGSAAMAILAYLLSEEGL